MPVGSDCFGAFIDSYDRKPKMPTMNMVFVLGKLH